MGRATFVMRPPSGLFQPWQLAVPAYRRVGSFDVSGQETNLYGLAFSSDGTVMFICGFDSEAVHQYDLSTAWDVTSATFDASFDFSAQTTVGAGLAFSDDGTVMYLASSDGDAIYQYDLSVAWDITSATFDDSLDVSAQDIYPRDPAFNDDGTVLYLAGEEADAIQQYDLSAAWDVTSATHRDSFDTSNQEEAPNGLAFKPDGTRLYVCGPTSDRLHEYSLSTPWDVTTAGYSRLLDPDDAAPRGVLFKPDGTVMFVLANSAGVVQQYELRK